MSQTNYNTDPTPSFAGMLGDQALDAHMLSRANGAAAAQPFGIMVRADAANPEDQFDIFSAASQAPLGVLVHKHDQENPALAGDLGVDLLEEASVLSKGRIWVRVEEAVAPGDGVFFRHTAGGGGSVIGYFRNDADTATCDQVDAARWIKGSAGAGLALLELNLP
jgi:hypothetical protein